MKTKWFDAMKRPSRKGVYERRYPMSQTVKYAMWDGSRWHSGAYDIDTAWFMNNVSGYQCDEGDPKWRGLNTKDGK